LRIWAPCTEGASAAFWAIMAMPTLAMPLAVWAGEASLEAGGLCWLAGRRLWRLRAGCA
jgi:hypothetical protein